MALRYPRDMGTEWMNLKRQVKDAFTSANSRVPYARIGAGVVQVFSSLQVQAGAFLKFSFATNATGLFMGRHFSGADPVDGMFMRRADNSLAFWTFTRVSDGYGYTAIYDQQGNIIVSDDAVVEQGLARPWIPYTFVNWSELANTLASRVTANTTDTDIILAHTNVQHGRVRATGYVTAPTSTCELKFWSYPDNTLLYSETVSDGWQINKDFPATGWEFGGQYYIKVSIRRASGTGNVGFTLVSLMGRQS